MDRLRNATGSCLLVSAHDARLAHTLKNVLKDALKDAPPHTTKPTVIFGRI